MGELVLKTKKGAGAKFEKIFKRQPDLAPTVVDDNSRAAEFNFWL